jgi:hypothetical protein
MDFCERRPTSKIRPKKYALLVPTGGPGHEVINVMRRPYWSDTVWYLSDLFIIYLTTLPVAHILQHLKL